MNGKIVFDAMRVVVIWTAAAAGASTAPASASAPASAPDTQPAAEIVLVRIGDRNVITQADFERVIEADPATGYTFRNRILMTMTQEHLIWLYLQDHPEVVPADQIRWKMGEDARMGGFESIEAARKDAEARGHKWSDYERFVVVNLAKANLVKKGLELGADEAYLKRMFEGRREEFDGTYVRARQIGIHVPVYATPQERRAVHEKLRQMREDILAGRRTWEECVAESDTALRNGDMGTFNRHRMKNETLAGAAFRLAPGEISEVVETMLGYHLVQVKEKVSPGVPWEHSKKEMRKWLELEPLAQLLETAMARYPIVGVQPPRPPKLPPASQPQTAPAASAPATTAPATRPPPLPDSP